MGKNITSVLGGSVSLFGEGGFGIFGGLFLFMDLIDLLKPDYRKTRTQTGIKTNLRSTEAVIPVVYGTQMVGGNFAYANTSGTHNKYLHVALILAQGECNAIHQVDGVDQIFIDDKIMEPQTKQ